MFMYFSHSQFFAVDFHADNFRVQNGFLFFGKLFDMCASCAIRDFNSLVSHSPCGLKTWLNHPACVTINQKFGMHSQYATSAKKLH